MSRFQPEEILRVLNAHAVDYVVIGGYAAVAQGSPYPTSDIDVTPDLAHENMNRLSRALTELGARVRHPDIPEGLPFGHDATSLTATLFWNLITPFGDLDLSLHPAAVGEYPGWLSNAIQITVRDVQFKVAGLADIIRSKDAANRDKDRRVLPLLRRLLDDQSTER